MAGAVGFGLSPSGGGELPVWVKLSGGIWVKAFAEGSYYKKISHSHTAGGVLLSGGLRLRGYTRPLTGPRYDNGSPIVWADGMTAEIPKPYPQRGEGGTAKP